MVDQPSRTLCSADIASAGGNDELYFKSNKRFSEKRKALYFANIANLKHIEEHKFFAKLDYSSLYKYLIEELKYSEGEANTTVADVKLMKKSPADCEKFISGELSLTNGKDLFRAMEQFGQRITNLPYKDKLSRKKCHIQGRAA